jgi:hypothetical protein
VDAKGDDGRDRGTPASSSHSARVGGFEPIEMPQESLLGDGQVVSGGGDQSVEKAPAERDVAQQAEELKDSIIDLVLSAHQRDEIWGEE